MPGVNLFISIDTEEDNWHPARSGITIENIRRLPELDSFLARLGARATYFLTYQVLLRPWATELVRTIRQTGRCEIGAHLHPWNTPPMPEPLTPRLTMTKNLPYELQLAKLQNLTERIRTVVGASPVSFRAGRWGLNHDTVRALLECGYRVDASVTPTVNWEACDDGPNFQDAPLSCYRIDGTRDVREPADQGLLEVPNSFGYSRRPFRLWDRVHRALSASAVGPIRPLGLANRLRVVRKIALTPELGSAQDMLLLSRRLLGEGIRHLQLFLHSPTLTPGLTPYTPTAADVDRFYATLERYLEGLHRMADVRFATMSEAERWLTPAVATRRSGSPSG